MVLLHDATSDERGHLVGLLRGGGTVGSVSPAEDLSDWATWATALD